MTRRLHRLLGAVMVLPFVLWTVTGLAFLVKPGWDGAYELLEAFRDEPIDRSGIMPVAIVASDSATRIELGTTALGIIYRIREHGGGARLLHAPTGTRLSPIGTSDARKVAEDAAARARASRRYGQVIAARERDEVIEIDFAGGATIRVGRDDLSLAQSGPDTRRIDALYRIHYLQWTGLRTIDRSLAILALVATWALAALGVRLIRRQP